jgi:hypothetical protein
MPAGDVPKKRVRPPAAHELPEDTLREEDQELIRCPECPAMIVRAQLETHLRRVHKIYQFRAVQRTLEQTIAYLFSLVAGPDSDLEAWTTLVDIAREAYGPRADAMLAASLGSALMRVEANQRDECIAAVAQTIAAGGCSPGMLALVAADPEVIARQLALALATRLPALIDPSLGSTLRAVLTDRRLPADATLAAAVVLARRSETDRKTRLEVYKALAAGLGKARAVERLRELAGQLGPEPLLDEYCVELENKVRMACPRCPAQLRRPQMVAHLWNEHKLMLNGLRVREPWQMIEDWIDEYRLKNDADILDRCHALAQRMDPDNGLQRVQRLCLAHGIEDAEARKAFLAEAAEQHASLCPHCFALVPVPGEVPARPLNAWRGRVSAHGYRVEVRDTGLLSRLEIETPTSILHRGHEPPRRLTAKGALVLFVGPPVTLALGVACGLLAPRLPPLVPVLLFLTAAGVMAFFVRWRWRRPRVAADRAIDFAWFWLVPRLLAEGFSPTDSSFLSGLARTSLDRGRPSLRTAALERAVHLTEKAVAASRTPVEHLADLQRLAISDAVRAGADPVPLVVKQIGRCFDGNLSFSYAERLLGGWETDWWSHLDLRRLRVLLCDRAFEAGFELRNLLAAGAASPALDAILDTTDDPTSLACLRLLWAWRPRQPWDRCGEAATVFELAARRGRAGLLLKYPDLLLVPETDSEGEDEQPILLCARGVVFWGQLFPEAPRISELRSKRLAGEVVYEVTVGRERFEFRDDPAALLESLSKWVRFHFKEFLPQVGGVARWKSSSVSAALRARETVPCPECSRAVLTRAGQVGRSFDVEEERASS